MTQSGEVYADHLSRTGRVHGSHERRITQSHYSPCEYRWRNVRNPDRDFRADSGTIPDRQLLRAALGFERQHRIDLCWRDEDRKRTERTQVDSDAIQRLGKPLALPPAQVASYGREVPPEYRNDASRSHGSWCCIQIRAEYPVNHQCAHRLSELRTRRRLRYPVDMYVHVVVFRMQQQIVDEVILLAVKEALHAYPKAAAETGGKQKRLGL